MFLVVMEFVFFGTNATYNMLNCLGSVTTMVFLKEYHVDMLICGGIGGGAQMALAEAGIALYGGVSGEADAAVDAFLKEELDFNPDVQCNHHGDHHHGEHCGEHHDSCGGHCGHHA